MQWDKSNWRRSDYFKVILYLVTYPIVTVIFSYESDGKPAIRIIKPNVTDYQEIAFDTLTMRDFVKYKSTNYILAKIDDINNYFIVSPKGSSPNDSP